MRGGLISCIGHLKPREMFSIEPLFLRVYEEAAIELNFELPCLSIQHSPHLRIESHAASNSPNVKISSWITHIGMVACCGTFAIPQIYGPYLRAEEHKGREAACLHLVDGIASIGHCEPEEMYLELSTITWHYSLLFRIFFYLKLALRRHLKLLLASEPSFQVLQSPPASNRVVQSHDPSLSPS